jgi:hypothetical protein
MKVIWTVFLSIAALAIVAGTAFLLTLYFKPKPGGLRVDTNFPSSVYIDNTLVGKTPYKGTYAAGQVTLKLVPESSDVNLLPFETRLTLTSNIETVVRREFAKTEEESSGDIISFEKDSSGLPSLVVISTPDNAQVSLDGVPRGFAPYKTSTISPATHQITVKAPGYADRVMTIKTLNGFRLTVFAKLARTNDEVQQKDEDVTQTQPKIYVQILSTPTGFLRVRTKPGSAGEEIAEVKPGEKFELLSEDAETGWYEIQYQDPKPGLPKGITGWISDQYAQKLDDVPSTPSANLNTSG